MVSVGSDYSDASQRSASGSRSNRATNSSHEILHRTSQHVVGIVALDGFTQLARLLFEALWGVNLPKASAPQFRLVRRYGMHPASR